MAMANGKAPSAKKELALALAKFIDASPTPFHMCAESGALLTAAGFTELSETDAWSPVLKPGGSYFYVRNGSTLVAFTVGGAFKAGNGFTIVGAHTDSPVLKLKPSSKRSAHGYLQLNVETYGGGLWYTWFDRELTLAGAAIVKLPDGSFTKKLVFIKRGLLRVPSLAIHLQTADERSKFGPNKETHMMPIAAMVGEALNKSSGENGEEPADERHAPELLKLLAAELNCTPSAILDFELSLCDMQPSAVWGVHDEFLSAPRLDNQMHCYTALRALTAHAAAMPPTQPDVCAIALFDHEEVGSESNCGAGSTVMQELMQRVAACFAPASATTVASAFGAAQAANEALLISIRKSFLLSADTAHAVHPNYAERHQGNHAPKLNSGTVIKTNDNQRYATNSESGFVVRELCRRHGLGVQEFMVKNDCPCGSTIGPMIASKTGVRTVDLGAPLLSMHSIRETCGVADVDEAERLFAAFFASFAALDDQCNFACRQCGGPNPLAVEVS